MGKSPVGQYGCMYKTFSSCPERSVIAIARDSISPVATTTSAPSQAAISASSISVRDPDSPLAAAFAADVGRPLARNSLASRD